MEHEYHHRRFLHARHMTAWHSDFVCILFGTDSSFATDMDMLYVASNPALFDPET
jgi:hypothetical protein